MFIVHLLAEAVSLITVGLSPVVFERVGLVFGTHAHHGK